MIDPDVITRELGTGPKMAARAGSKITTPTGATLPSVYKSTVWSDWRDFEGKGSFLAGAVPFLDLLELRKEFVGYIIKSGGSIDIILSLYGGVNMGDCIHWAILKRLVDLRINLGVEVFPKWN
jgi:hypothetical protein